MDGDSGAGGWGGQNKTAWRGMQQRTIKALTLEANKLASETKAAGNAEEAARIRASAQADCDLVAQVTQHWMRHHLATRLFAGGADVRTVMDQGGWLDASSALVYAHDVPENRRKLVRAALGAELAIDTPPDTAAEGKAEKVI